MSIFAQMSEAKVQSRGIKIEKSGVYQVEIDTIKMQESNQGFGTLFIVEFLILEGDEENPEGSRRSWVQKPEHRSKTDLGNIKEFVTVLLGSPPDKSDFEATVSEAQPYQGRQLKLETNLIQTKSGFPFVIHNWEDSSSFKAQTKNEKSTVKSTVPSIPKNGITKEAWLSGEGKGTPHPDNSKFEYHVDHIDWGVRPAAK